MTIKIWPSKDVAEINRVLNHPDVKPWVTDKTDEPLDASVQVNDANNLFLMGEFGGQMYTRFMPGIFEVHSFVLPEGRGRWALELSWATLEWIFTKTDAFEVLTRIPHSHPAAKGLAVKAGMTQEYFRPDGVMFNGEVVPVDVYKITIQEWVRKAPRLLEVGDQFHDWLNTEAAKLGRVDRHEDDPEHNRIVAASLAMARNGQAPKAVVFYNRWAWIVRHATISLLSVDPVKIGMDIGIIQVAGDGGLSLMPAGVSGCGTKPLS